MVPAFSMSANLSAETKKSELQLAVTAMAGSLWPFVCVCVCVCLCVCGVFACTWASVSWNSSIN